MELDTTTVFLNIVLWEQFFFIIYVNGLPEVVKCKISLMNHKRKRPSAKISYKFIGVMDSEKSPYVSPKKKSHVLKLRKCHNIKHTERYTLDRPGLPHIFGLMESNITKQIQELLSENFGDRCKKICELFNVHKKPIIEMTESNNKMTNEKLEKLSAEIQSNSDNV